MSKKLPETQDERFMDYYQRIQNGQDYSFVGIHFGAEQYADLADAVMAKIYYFMQQGDLRRLQSWIEYSEKLRSRKRTRWFDPKLREFNGG
jgi:hypothetical protein